MEKMKGFVSQLDAIRGQIERVGPEGLDPNLVTRLDALTKELKAAVVEAMAGTQAECMALVGQVRGKADELKKRQAASATKEPSREQATHHPWEEHQGLSTSDMGDLVQALLRPARPAPGRPRT